MPDERTAIEYANGLNDQFRKLSERVTNLEGSDTGFPAIAVMRDEKAQNTAGGTFTSGAWRTRDLNSEDDPSNLVSIAANQFTPEAGTYLILALAPGYYVGHHQAQLYNATGASAVLTGESAWSANAAGSSQTTSHIVGVFTANGTDAYEIQHQCSSTYASTGFGTPANLTTEVYTQVVLIKLS